MTFPEPMPRAEAVEILDGLLEALLDAGAEAYNFELALPEGVQRTAQALHVLINTDEAAGTETGAPK